MELNKIVEQKSLLLHPFYQLWLKGELPMEALQKYTTQYFQLVDHLPRWVSLLHTNCESEKTRNILLHNLMEEEGHGNGGVAHTKLWVDFGVGLGASENEVMTGKLLPQTKEAVEVIRAECAKSLENGAGALYAYESQVPAISEEKISSLKEQYGIGDEKTLRFFEVHKTADIKHGAVWKALSKESVEAQKSAAVVSDILWKMFDGMWDAYVPEDVKMNCAC